MERIPLAALGAWSAVYQGEVYEKEFDRTNGTAYSAPGWSRFVGLWRFEAEAAPMMDAMGPANSRLLGRTSSVGLSRQGNFEEDDFDDTGSSHERDSYQETPYRNDDLDPDEEHAEGQRQEDELLTRHQVWDCSTTRAWLANLLESLLPFRRRLEIPYEFVPLDSPTPFASSCCHGAVYFSRGLLGALDQEQVRFFAAHEMAHTELRHYASRQRRLQELRRGFPAAPGSAARQRLEAAAVLVVRHQEEFEADHQAARWTGNRVGGDALTRLHQSCQTLAPESLRRPTHPPFELRLERMRQGLEPPDPVSYLWSLVAP